MVEVADLIRLMLVTDDHLLQGRDLVQVCLAAERGGVTSIQIRRAGATPRELAASVRAVQDVVGVPVLVRDRADVAIATGAAGVHLGSDEIPVQMVRRMAPRGFVIGVSVGMVDALDSGRGADFWVVGPLRVEGSGEGPGEGLGIRGFSALLRRGEGRLCIATGGVRPADATAVIRAGGVGVAVGSGILGDPDLAAGAEQYARALATPS